jgi:hypothetical protein
MRRSASTYFQQRFGRKRGGDVASGDGGGRETLDLLIDLKIRFTILSPGHASRGAADSGIWNDTTVL